MNANTIVNVFEDATDVIVPSDEFFTDALAQADADAAAAADSELAAGLSAAAAAASAASAAASKTGAETAEVGAAAAEAAVLDAIAGAGGSLGTITLQAADRTILAALDSDLGLSAQLLEGDRAGHFKFYVPTLDAVDFMAKLAADTEQGIYVAPAPSTGKASDGSDGAWVRTDATVWRLEWFGAVGDGAEDDTAALIGLANLASAFGRVAAHGVAGKTYIVGNISQLTPNFRNLAGFELLGNGATIKTKDSGCPTDSLGYNWGQWNFDNCSNGLIGGWVFDGNRDGQLHTDGEANGFGFNAGINFWTSNTDDFAVDNVRIVFCSFKNHGQLTNSTDRRGDGINSQSGLTNFRVEHCLFERVGRWAMAISAGTVASSHIYFQHNTVLNDNRVDEGQFPWGALDIEDTGLANHDIYIDDNVFSGTAYISYGGNAATPTSVTVTDTYIRRNKWIIPAGDNSGNVPFVIGNGAPGTGTYREFLRLVIEDNEVVWEGTSNTFAVGQTSKLTDFRMTRNTFRAMDASAGNNRGLSLALAGALGGRVEFRDNDFIGLGEAISNGNSWYADPSPSVLDLIFENNRFDDCARAYLLEFNDIAVAAGSKITFRGGYSRNTRFPASAEYVDGGSVPTEYYDQNDRDAVWVHANLTYKGFNNSGALGYATGQGGTVTQGGSKATGVIINALSGQITMNSGALAAGAKVSFTVANSQVSAADVVTAAVAGGGTANAYRASITAVLAGNFKVTVENITGGSLSESPVINFAVIKGATA